MLPTVTRRSRVRKNVAVRDTVHYNNVTPGKTYKVTGTLYEKVLDKNGKVTKKVFKDKDGNPVTAEANFTAEDSYGNVDVTFYFDGSSLKEGTSLVAFESLFYNDNGQLPHADVNDSGQTVIITKLKLSTTATDALDGDKNLIGEDNATMVDTVHYMNVTPGKTYKVSGTLYEKVTDKGRQGSPEAAPRCRRQPRHRRDRVHSPKPLSVMWT